MNDCFEVDDLVTLGAALGWSPTERLRHLSGCEGCRQRLEEVRALHETLNASIAPRAGFTDRVLRSLGGGEARQTSGVVIESSAVRLVRFVNPALAGLTAFFALALAAGSSGSPGPGLPTLLASGFVAAATLWWDRRSRAVPASPAH